MGTRTTRHYTEKLRHDTPELIPGIANLLPSTHTPPQYRTAYFRGHSSALPSSSSSSSFPVRRAGPPSSSSSRLGQSHIECGFLNLISREHTLCLYGPQHSPCAVARTDIALSGTGCAMCGRGIPYGAMRVCCYAHGAMCGTDIAYGATRVVLCA
eukprot:889041-Rhodomonas_salina.1